MTAAAATRLILDQHKLPAPQTEPVERDEIGERLAELLRACEKLIPSKYDESGEQHTVLDAEYNGYRYLLLKVPARSLRPGMMLSPREQEIGRMVAKGYPNKTIAAVLEISSWTVCTHLRRMFAKLAVSSRAAMVAKLIEEGVLHDSLCSPRRPRFPEAIE